MLVTRIFTFPTKTNFLFWVILSLVFANAFNLDKTENLSSGKLYQNDKIVHWSKLKAVADNETNVTEKRLKFVWGG